MKNILLNRSVLVMTSLFSAKGFATAAAGSSISNRATFGAGNEFYLCLVVICTKTNFSPMILLIDAGLGCYWGTEKFFKHDFGEKAFPGSGRVLEGRVGFMGPSTAKPNPTYKEVCLLCTSGGPMLYCDLRGETVVVDESPPGLLGENTAR